MSLPTVPYHIPEPSVECPKCKCPKNRTYGRGKSGFIRYHECLECGTRFRSLPERLIQKI